MRFLDHPKRLLVLVGPTAVGKTETALQLAERLNGEVVSADSRLFYRGMDIGTAKPTAQERQRVVHHLIDVADPGETWSLAVFQQAAAAAIADIQQRGRLPLLVGGTGQYVRAVVEAWQPPKISPNPALRGALEAWAAQIGAAALHERLRRLDAEAAARIEPNNVRRTVRALEVIFTTGERFSAQRTRSVSPYALLQLGLTRPRPELYERVDRRIEQMLADGWVEEVRALLARGCSADWPTFSAIGYREICAHLAGQMTLDEAVAQMKRLTR
ncbi:MAG: tRNA (adenosine(37)-N6)-dimethylallyltransferase MiaA, partial [Longilinea sp.]|nr:tRNA (adenosine(37)-N6)-dimethylallyltransferase MiaA [Longilinea sp.]